MASLAAQIKADSTCGPDYRAQNPLVLQAYNGLLAYPLLYKAGCLQDNSSSPSSSSSSNSSGSGSDGSSGNSGGYCFASAITNALSPSDSYIYYLPLGVSLPGGARPSCNQCLKDTMAVFQQGARDANQPVSATYVDAAQQIDLGCGPAFVNVTVPVKAGKSGTGRARGVDARVGMWGLAVGVAAVVAVMVGGL